MVSWKDTCRTLELCKLNHLKRILTHFSFIFTLIENENPTDRNAFAMLLNKPTNKTKTHTHTNTFEFHIELLNWTGISSMTVFAEANVDVDLRMLRSFRVLRPLKLVSRIPSKRYRVNFHIWIKWENKYICSRHVPEPTSTFSIKI